MRIQSIFIGGVVVGVLSTSYLSLINLLCCMGVVIGGGTAAWHYISTADRSIDPVEGATLGAGAGVVGSLLSSLFDWALRPIGLDGQSALQNLAGVDMEQMVQQNSMMQEQMMQEPTMGMMLVSLVMGAIFLAVFGAIGGAIGASLFGEDDDNAASPPPPPESPSWSSSSE